MARMKFLFGIMVVAVAAAVSAAWFSTRATAPHPAPASASGPPGYALIVDVSERRLYVQDSGQIVRSYPVAVGQPEHATPRGTYHIRHIVWNPGWVPPDAKWARHKTPKAPGEDGNPVGRVKMFFAEPDYYIHGTREYDSLGEAESHGCVRMANGSAIALAKDVMAHGGKPKPASWFRRVLDHFRDTREVYLSDPIPVYVRG